MRILEITPLKHRMVVQSVISELRRLRQENHYEFKMVLIYIVSSRLPQATECFSVPNSIKIRAKNAFPIRK